MQSVDGRLLAEDVRRYRDIDAAFAHWAAGHGPIHHSDETQWNVREMVERLWSEGVQGDGGEPWEVLAAADRLASAAMWLAVHQVYAMAVHLDGRPLEPGDFKDDPQGHLGGVLNMVPAYVGYLLVNALTGCTRSWLMGQGHCVGAVDSVNVLVGNLGPAHADRGYTVTDQGLSRFARDFYSYALDERGQQDSPLGSHVNAHTAGGLAEGGYLGIAELQYVHMPLPGERLVVFLSDGAFEEQRGSDWAPRWWRCFDSGLVAPVMIANGRRIDQRTTMAQSGGIAWFVDHLRLNNFDPMVIDGTDPAAFAWAILETERRELAIQRSWEQEPGREWTFPLPYAVAVAPKGYGFYGAGGVAAHNLPLPGNPRHDRLALAAFNGSIGPLWVAPDELERARARFRRHTNSGRDLERDHPLAVRDVSLQAVPDLRERRFAGSARRQWVDPTWPRSSPMDAVDEAFVALVGANPHLRPRVGNPDEMRSNRLMRTLETLKFRVTDPDEGVPEAIDGAVITALNEEAVVSAALANRGGINLVHTYEAFGPKMLGVVRQEIIFTDALLEAGRRAGWLSVPLVLTSHTWENGKNEQSHQDPTMAEALLGEVSNLSRVLFAADANTAKVLMEAVYQTRAQVWTMVVPKGDVPDLFTLDEARSLLADGVQDVAWSGHRSAEAEVVLTAIGAYQLHEVLRASARLAEADVPHRVAYMLEPGRFRWPRTEREAAHVAPTAVVAALYPASAPVRVFVCHTRPEPILGVLGPLHTGPTTRGLGYTSRGGTLDVDGLLFVNRCSWAHVLETVARAQGLDAERYLRPDEVGALRGRRSPMGVVAGRRSEAEPTDRTDSAQAARQRRGR